MAFEWTISLGQVVQVVVILLGGGLAVQRFYFALDKRLSVAEIAIAAHAKKLEREIEVHGRTFDAHAQRMERWETTLFKLVGDLQRVIGQVELYQRQPWSGDERRGAGR